MESKVCAFALLVFLFAYSSAEAVLIAYEGFDYANDSSPLDGKSGGTGWLAPWVSMTSPFDLSVDDTSLDSPIYPFTPVGDRVSKSAGSQGIGYREFSGIDLSQDGNVLYASALIKKDGDATPGTGGNNLEFDLGVNGGTTIRFGSTSSQTFFLDVSSNVTGSVVLGDTYFLVMKVTSNAATPDLVEASFFGPGDTVPGTDPTTWSLTHNLDSNAAINTARAWIGASASGSIDEIRLGTTWGDVAIFDPNFVQGDFNNSGGLDIGDFNILANNLFSGTTYSQGDFDGNGSVDLRDFISFREAYHAAGFSLAVDLVPEPATGTLVLATFTVIGIHYRRRSIR